mmetsp:Transcript_4206/g.12081  ORF Transcript_4206/g.12081 Transcript_4206/m.12081 type:complete len:337 (+) Transcript_4206:166-1176(+)
MSRPGDPRLLTRRLEDRVALRASNRDAVPLETVRHILHGRRLHEGVVALIADRLLLPVVAPTADGAVVADHQAVRLAHRGLSDDLGHDLNACGAHHVHDARLRLRAATRRPVQLLGNAVLVLRPRVLHVRNRRALGSDAAANYGPGALRDVGRALPTGAHLRHGIAERDLDGFGEALLHGMAELPVRVRAPAEDPAALRHSGGVPTAAGEVDDLLVLHEPLDLLRPLLSDAPLAVQPPAQLPEVVVPPGVELAFFRKRAHVLVARPDLRHLEPLQAHLALRLVAVAPRLGEQPWKVRGLETAPAPQLAPLRQAHGEVAAASDLADVGLVGQLRQYW